MVYDKTVTDIRDKEWITYPIDTTLSADIISKMESLVAANSVDPVVKTTVYEVVPSILENK